MRTVKAKTFLHKGRLLFFILTLIGTNSVTAWSVEKDSESVIGAIERGITWVIQNTADPTSVFLPENLFFFHILHQVSSDRWVRELAKKVVVERLHLYNLMHPDIKEDDPERIMEYMVVATLTREYGGNAEHYLVAIKNMLRAYGEERFLKDLDPADSETFDMGTVTRLYFLNRLGIQTKLDYSEYETKHKKIYYRKRFELIDEHAYLMQSYFVTHVVYALSDFGRICLDRQVFSKEYVYLKDNLKKIIALCHLDLLGEFLGALKMFKGNPNFEDFEQAISLSLFTQNDDGSWKNEKILPEYVRHTTMTNLLGLLNYHCHIKRNKVRK